MYIKSLIHDEVNVLYTLHISSRPSRPGLCPHAVKVTRHFYEGEDEAFTTDIATMAPPLTSYPPGGSAQNVWHLSNLVDGWRLVHEHSDTLRWVMVFGHVLTID